MEIVSATDHCYRLMIDCNAAGRALVDDVAVLLTEDRVDDVARRSNLAKQSSTSEQNIEAIYVYMCV